MDQVPLFEGQLNDGQKLLDRLTEAGDAVAGAWVKESDRWQWYLYLVTPLVGDDGATGPAYRRIGTVIRAMPQPFWINAMDVKVVGLSDPIGKAILDVQRRHPGPLPIRYGGFKLGEVLRTAGKNSGH